MSGCPITSFALYEDYDFVAGAFGTPWSNTDEIKLVNGEDPDNAYLNITTFEEDRATWIKHFCLMATTLGGVTSNNDNVDDRYTNGTKRNAYPIHFKVTILKTLDSGTINHAPQFLYDFDYLNIDVYERDIILKNTTIFEYHSPGAKDSEDDQIEILFNGLDYYPYIRADIHENHSFSLYFDSGQFNYFDRGEHYLWVKVQDDNAENDSSERWQYFWFNITYTHLNPEQTYLLKYSDLEEDYYDFASVQSVEIYCPEITWTNSTVV